MALGYVYDMIMQAYDARVNDNTICHVNYVTMEFGE